MSVQLHMHRGAVREILARGLPLEILPSDETGEDRFAVVPVNDQDFWINSWKSLRLARRAIARYRLLQERMREEDR